MSDYRDLMAWINSMKGLVSSEELANDVTGAEALLERHQVQYFKYHQIDNGSLICFKNVMISRTFTFKLSFIS